MLNSLYADINWRFGGKNRAATHATWGDVLQPIKQRITSYWLSLPANRDTHEFHFSQLKKGARQQIAARDAALIPAAMDCLTLLGRPPPVIRGPADTRIPILTRLHCTPARRSNAALRQAAD